jgi:DNA polymerase-3 subunit delta'
MPVPFSDVPQPEGNKSCGQCRGCQLMQAGTHPDYYTLAPEKGKARSVLTPCVS